MGRTAITVASRGRRGMTSKRKGTKAIPSESSSRSSSLDDVAPAKIEADPSRAKKDTEIGGFYLKSGDFQGALARFQDATTYDPTNVDAIFGLAKDVERALDQQVQRERQPCEAGSRASTMAP